jgi:hypothetical protein
MVSVRTRRSQPADETERDLAQAALGGARKKTNAATVSI